MYWFMYSNNKWSTLQIRNIYYVYEFNIYAYATPCVPAYVRVSVQWYNYVLMKLQASDPRRICYFSTSPCKGFKFNQRKETERNANPKSGIADYICCSVSETRRCLTPVSPWHQMLSWSCRKYPSKKFSCLPLTCNVCVCVFTRCKQSSSRFQTSWCKIVQSPLISGRRMT